MACRDVNGRARAATAENRGVDIAHPLDLLLRHSFGHERVFHGRDLGHADFSEEIAEFVLELLGVGPVVELSDDPLEGLDPVT